MNRKQTARVWPLFALCALLVSCGLGKTVPGRETPTPYGNEKVQVDISNLGRGTVAVTYTGVETGGVKAQLTREGGEPYTYDLRPGGEPEILPLTEGDGEYTLTVLERVEADQYKGVFSCPLTLALDDPLAPFLEASQMVNYGGSIRALAEELTAGMAAAGQQADALLRYVTESISYDWDKADTVEYGYLPDPAETVETGKGICYDYAALLAALLRSRGIPCRLEVGWAGSQYHAWVSVWSGEAGELTGPIPLKEGWTRLDPTYLSTQGYTAAMLEYMAGEDNYQCKYVY